MSSFDMLKAGFTPPPPKVTIYTGPAVPVAYDPNWQLFTNLKPEQVAWFQAQPEWADFVAWVALNPVTATINAQVSPAAISSALAAASISSSSKVM